jgi:DinB superfamily
MNTSAVIGVESRVLNEGYGPGAWHGADLKAAIAAVTPALAFWRPAEGRHNIAEIALHHAYCARGVRAQISGRPSEPFILPGEDWFEAADERAISWENIQAIVHTEQERLGALVAEIEAGQATSPLADGGRFDLVLGITGHAIYHAGQIQLIKRHREGGEISA